MLGFALLNVTFVNEGVQKNEFSSSLLFRAAKEIEEQEAADKRRREREEERRQKEAEEAARAAKRKALAAEVQNEKDEVDVTVVAQEKEPEKQYRKL